MSADAGIVRIHAQTICRATPQRTADSRRVAPTPTMAPVIVCVVLMPTPSGVADVDRERRAGFGGEPADRLQLGDLRAHRLDDAPAAGQRAEADRRRAPAGSTQNGIGSLPTRRSGSRR